MCISQEVPTTTLVATVTVQYNTKKKSRVKTTNEKEWTFFFNYFFTTVDPYIHLSIHPIRAVD